MEADISGDKQTVESIRGTQQVLAREKRPCRGTGAGYKNDWRGVGHV